MCITNYKPNDIHICADVNIDLQIWRIERYTYCIGRSKYINSGWMTLVPQKSDATWQPGIKAPWPRWPKPWLFSDLYIYCILSNSTKRLLVLAMKSSKKAGETKFLRMTLRCLAMLHFFHVRIWCIFVATRLTIPETNIFALKIPVGWEGCTFEPFWRANLAPLSKSLFVFMECN